jgi:hypothetical protein
MITHLRQLPIKAEEPLDGDSDLRAERQ